MPPGTIEGEVESVRDTRFGPTIQTGSNTQPLPSTQPGTSLQTVPGIQSDSTLVVQIHLAEYSCLRAEILQLVNIEHACMGFAITVVAAVLSLKNNWIEGNYWAVVPTLCCLGIVYCDLDTRIMRCAHYIDGALKPKLAKQVPRVGVLEWESYIRDELKGLPRRRTLLGELGSTFQGLIFLLPSIVFWIFGMLQSTQVKPLVMTGYMVGLVAIGSLCY